MVRAILDRRKTQTRRTVRVGNSFVDGLRWSAAEFARLDFSNPSVVANAGLSSDGTLNPFLSVPRHSEGRASVHKVSSAWQTRDRLWVRETWSVDADIYQVRRELKDRKGGVTHGPYFRADPGNEDRGPWRQGILLPRWASRITLQITGARVERLQDITAKDCKAEGIASQRSGEANPSSDLTSYLRYEYRLLWENINGAGSWDRNPWVWVMEFKRVKR